MMFDLGRVEIDPKKLETGVWWSIYRDSDGGLAGRIVKEPTEDGCLLIRPMGTEYERKVEEVREPYLAAIRAGRVTDDESVKLLAMSLAGTVLADWRNISIQGEPVPYSVQKAVELLSDKRWLSLREFVVQAGQRRAAVLAELDRQAEGN